VRDRSSYLPKVTHGVVRLESNPGCPNTTLVTTLCLASCFLGKVPWGLSQEECGRGAHS
jgi:hypothetical protein